MATHETSHKEEKVEVHEERPSYMRFIIIAVLLVAVGLGLFFYFRNRNRDNVVTDTSNEIRDAFRNPGSDPPAGTSSPIFTPPAPNSENPTTTPPTTTVPPTTTTPPPRAAAPPRIAAPSGPVPTAPAPSVPSIYRSNMGFEFSMPGNWVVDNTSSSGNKVIFMDRNSGGTVGFIEVYNNGSGETLDSLSRIYQGSPSVYRVSQTTVASQPAVEFLSNRTDGNGIAIPYNNKIYYLRGAAASPDMRSRFRFAGAT